MITVGESLRNAITDTPQLNQYWVLVYSKDDTLLKTITPKEIFSNSKINKSCSSNSSLEVGGCYAGELSLSIVAEAYRENPIVFNRYNKLRVRQYFWYEGIDNEDYRKTSEGRDSTENFVELGTYHINTVTSNDYKADIQAYDLMYALDEKLTDSDNDNLRGTKRTPTELLTWVCNKARKNGYNPTVNILSTINNNLKLKLSEDSTYDTIRELVSDVAFVLGGFAVIGYNNDEIKIMGYSKTTKQLGISHKNILHYSVDIEQSKVGKFMGTCCGFTYEYASTGNVDTYTEESKLLRGIMPYDSKQLNSEVTTAYDSIRSDYINKVFVGCEHEITSYPIVELGDNVSITRVYVRNNEETSETVNNILVTEVEHSFNSRTTIVSPSIDHTVVADNYKVSSSPKTSSGGGGGDEPEFDSFIEGITGVHYREIEVLSPISIGLGLSTNSDYKVSGESSYYVTTVESSETGAGLILLHYRNIYIDYSNVKPYIDDGAELISSEMDLSKFKFIKYTRGSHETATTGARTYLSRPFNRALYTDSICRYYLDGVEVDSFSIYDDVTWGRKEDSTNFEVVDNMGKENQRDATYEYYRNSAYTELRKYALNMNKREQLKDLSVFKDPITITSLLLSKDDLEDIITDESKNNKVFLLSLYTDASTGTSENYIETYKSTFYEHKTGKTTVDEQERHTLSFYSTVQVGGSDIYNGVYEIVNSDGYSGSPMFVTTKLMYKYEYPSGVDTAIDLINDTVDKTAQIDMLTSEIANLKTRLARFEDVCSSNSNDIVSINMFNNSINNTVASNDTLLQETILEVENNKGTIESMNEEVGKISGIETNLANNVENTRVNADNIATILSDYLTSLDLNTVTRRIQAIEDYIGMVDLVISLNNVYFNSESSELYPNAKFKSEELNIVFVNAYYYNKLKFVWDSNKDGTLFTLSYKARGTGTEYAVTAYKDITSKETDFDVSFGGDSSSYCYSNNGYYKQYYIKGTYGSQSEVSEPINIALVPKITRNSFTATRSGDVVTATLSLSGGFPDLKSLVPNGIPNNPECKYKCKYSLSTSSSTSSTKYKVLDEDYVWDKLTFQFSFEENKPSSTATSYYLHVSYGDGMITYSASVQVK